MLAETELIARLFLAALLGAIVGIEREISKKPAGMRTNSLVALGSCVFTIFSFYYFGADPARIAAGIVTGIGFLGAGIIINSGKNVHGITTAATVWAVAAIGMGIGMGAYSLSAVTVLLMLFVLKLKRSEKPLRRLQRPAKAKQRK